MIEPSDATQSVKLSDMDLRIGQTVQLITAGPQPRKYFTRLIGHVDQEFILLRVPVENGWTVSLNEGQVFDVRVFCGVSLYEFQSRLQALLLQPRNYMMFSCPNSIRQTRLRAHERAKCALPVRVVEAPVGAAQAGFQFQDLSGGGAALVGPVALGTPGDTLALAMDFHLVATNTDEHLVLRADIQSVQPLRDQSGQTTGYHHGIRFSVVEPRILLLVNELQKPRAF